MKKLQLALALLVVCYCSFSHSETVYGVTNNATDSGYNWVMQNVLPQQVGLEVTGVIYRYTAVKDPESGMIVNVQNEDAQNPGRYVFRETDDWTGLEGKTIYKVLPQPNVLIDRWGDGSIQVQGDGTVEDASVVYNYQFDPCFDPQSSPECPGYVPDIPDIPEPDLTDLYDQEQMFIDQEIEKETQIVDEDQKEKDRAAIARKNREKDRLEVALGAVNTALMSSEAALKHAELVALGESLLIPYNGVVMLGGEYREATQLKDSKLPENKKARRVRFAQQLLHEQMVESQYKNNN